jgi:hypothetical protein
MNFNKTGKVFTSKFVGTGPSSYKKRTYGPRSHKGWEPLPYRTRLLVQKKWRFSKHYYAVQRTLFFFTVTKPSHSLHAFSLTNKRGNMLLPSPGSRNQRITLSVGACSKLFLFFHTEIGGSIFLPKNRYTSNKPHDVKSRNTIIFIDIAVRTSKRTVRIRLRNLKSSGAKSTSHGFILTCPP